jgi:hypothetical protein
MFLTVWLLYGFSFGQFFTLVFRKSAEAVLVAVVVTVSALAVWLPALVLGGVQWWQILGTPVLLLGGTRLAMWAWAGGRLYTFKPALALASTGVLAGAWIGGSLWYRIAEVPEVGPPFDVRAFLASLPSPERNEAGQWIRRACQDLADYQIQVTNIGLASPMKALFPDEELTPAGPEIVALGGTGWKNHQFVEQLGRAIERGYWPQNGGPYSYWLDLLFAGQWFRDLQEAGKLPPGMIEDTRNMTTRTVLNLEPYRLVARLLLARALQLQARGDHAGALEQLTLTLVVARNLGNGAAMQAYLVGRAIEAEALKGFGRWLQKVGPQPELIRRALDELNRHEELLPPLSELVKAEYVVFHNSLQMLPIFRDDAKVWQPEAQVVNLAWYLPWEEQRRTRIMNAFFAGYLRAAQASVLSAQHLVEAERRQSQGRVMLEGWLAATSGPEADMSADDLARLIDESWLAAMLPHWSRDQLRRPHTQALARLRAARLQLALTLYQIQEGKPAAALEDLVPRYLAELPVDPVTGRAFQYRVSQGERYPAGDMGFAVGTPGGMGSYDSGAGVMVPGYPGGMMPGVIGGDMMGGPPGMLLPGKLIPAGQGIVEGAGLGEPVLVPQWPKQ